MSDLTTLETVKAYLGKSDHADDTVLQTLITAYSQAVRSYTNRDFTTDTYDIWRSGRGSVTLLTPQYPIVGVNIVEVDGVSIPAAPRFGAYGYRYSDRMVMLSGGAVFAIGAHNIHIQYTAGYATPPADVSEAVVELVALRFKMKGDNANWVSKSLNGDTITLNTKAMPEQVQMILNQYRNNVPA